MDNDYELSLDEILRTVETAEVVTFQFVVIAQRLLIDSRSSAVDGPLLKLVPAVKSPEERFRNLKQLRPRFRLPEKISTIWWPKHIQSLVTSGVWQSVAKRIIDSSHPGAAQQCEEVLHELLLQEKEEVRSAIVGKGYQALWECYSQGQPRRS